MKCNTLIIVGILLTVAAFFAIYHFETPPNTNKIDTIIQRDTLWKDTTLTIFKERPILKIVKIEKTDTFYTKDGKDTILKVENKQYQDTFTCQKDSIIIQNFISGINSKLDSTKVNWKKQETIITNTVTIEKYITKKKKFIDHFKVGVGVGYGYGFKTKEFEPFVGVSLNYNF